MIQARIMDEPQPFQHLNKLDKDLCNSDTDDVRSMHSNSSSTKALLSSFPTTVCSPWSGGQSPISKRSGIHECLQVPVDHDAMISREADFARATYLNDGLSSSSDSASEDEMDRTCMELVWEFDLKASMALNLHLHSSRNSLLPEFVAPRRPPIIILRTSTTSTISLLHAEPDDHVNEQDRELLEKIKRRPQRSVGMTEVTWLGVKQRSLIPYRHLAVDSRGRLIDSKNNVPFGSR